MRAEEEDTFLTFADIGGTLDLRQVDPVVLRGERGYVHDHHPVRGAWADPPLWAVRARILLADPKGTA
jgi:hypothetical protein